VLNLSFVSFYLQTAISWIRISPTSEVLHIARDCKQRLQSTAWDKGDWRQCEWPSAWHLVDLEARAVDKRKRL